MAPKESIEKPNDRFGEILYIAYKLGGWGVLAIVATFALKYIWDERTLVNRELISELRDGKSQTIKIIAQNTEALGQSSKTQEQVARAVEQLTEETRRNQK